MKCINCGKEIKEGSKYCRFCGTKQELEEVLNNENGLIVEDEKPFELESIDRENHAEREDQQDFKDSPDDLVTVEEDSAQDFEGETLSVEQINKNEPDDEIPVVEKEGVEDNCKKKQYAPIVFILGVIIGITLVFLLSKNNLLPEFEILGVDIYSQSDRPSDNSGITDESKEKTELSATHVTETPEPTATSTPTPTPTPTETPLPQEVYDSEAELTIVNGITDPSTNNDIVIPEATVSSYLWPDADKRLYSESDLDGMTEGQVRYLINEIYAREGYIFNNNLWLEYFEQKTWYSATVLSTEFAANPKLYLNTYESQNVDMINDYQVKHGFQEYS